MDDTQPLLAGIDHLHCVRIVRESGKCCLEVGEGAVLTVEVVVGIAHAEVPEMVTREIVRVWREEPDRLFEVRAVLCARRIVVGACQLAVELGGTLLGGECLDLRDDFLKFVVLVPNLAPFE